jgi:type II secretory pathway component PulF
MPGSRISPEELALFNSQLAAIARTEVPALPGLRALSRDIGRGRLRRVLDRLVSEIEAGKPLPDALSAVSDSLPPTYAAMIRAGVESRNLPAVLESMTQHYQATEDLKQKVRGALIYPAIIYFLCIAFLFFVVFVFMPTVTRFAEEMSLIIGTGTGLQTLVPALLILELGFGGAVLVLAVALKLASLSPSGARLAERICSAVPIYGAVGRTGALARFCSTFAFLLDAEVPIPEVLRLLQSSVGSPRIAHALDTVGGQTSHGMELSESLEQTGAFPHTLVWMVSQGEGSNTLGATFHDLSEFYTAETKRQAALAWNATTPLGVAILFLSGAPTMMGFWGILYSLIASLGEY